MMDFPQVRRRRTSSAVSDTLEILTDLCERMLAPAAEASGTRIAAEAIAACAALDAEGRIAWFEWLTDALAPPNGPLEEAAHAYLIAPTATTAARLTRAAEPPRQALLRRINTAPGGTTLLVTLRAELLAMLRTHPHLAPLNDDFAHLLASWFNRGFLSLQRIDWHSPAALLEKLIAYEAVHAIHDWNDLRRRLDNDRRCYGFFHPAMPGEPLIFVEVALTSGLPTSIDDILNAPARKGVSPEADTAVFYSISNCHAGLHGVSFGNLLIKQIVSDLCGEMPSLTRFATLSPVPTLSRWFDAERRHGDISSLCFDYLTANRLRAAPGSRPDPVAHFHLSNGARLERILTNADLSATGIAQSRGVMVNYLYDLATIDENAYAYTVEGSVAWTHAVEPPQRGADLIAGVI